MESRFDTNVPHKATVLVIGDVVGHGISASLLMASLQASLHTLVQDHDSPADVIQRLNLLFKVGTFVKCLLVIRLWHPSPLGSKLGEGVLKLGNGLLPGLGI